MKQHSARVSADNDQCWRSKTPGLLNAARKKTRWCAFFECEAHKCICHICEVARMVDGCYLLFQIFVALELLGGGLSSSLLLSTSSVDRSNVCSKACVIDGECLLVKQFRFPTADC